MSTDNPPPLMIPLGELARRCGRDRSTVYRWLRKKGVNNQGQGVLLYELRVKWPAMYSALMLAFVGPPPCPQCGGPTRCECKVCELEVA